MALLHEMGFVSSERSVNRSLQELNHGGSKELLNLVKRKIEPPGTPFLVGVDNIDSQSTHYTLATLMTEVAPTTVSESPQPPLEMEVDHGGLSNQEEDIHDLGSSSVPEENVEFVSEEECISVLSNALDEGFLAHAPFPAVAIECLGLPTRNSSYLLLNCSSICCHLLFCSGSLCAESHVEQLAKVALCIH